MNKYEKIIVVLLGIALGWYIFTNKNAPRVDSDATPPAQHSVATSPANTMAQQPAAPAAASPVQQPILPTLPDTPEEIVVLENDELKLELSSWGGAVKKATLKKYARSEGAISEENPPVEFDFSENPLGALGRNIIPYAIESKSESSVVFVAGDKRREVALNPGYLVSYNDNLSGADTISIGAMSMGASKNDLLSVDSWSLNAGKGKPGVVHHSEGDSPLKDFLAGGAVGGCSSSKNAASLPKSTTVEYRNPHGPLGYIALKNRFFVTALSSTEAQTQGFVTDITRDTSSATYRPESVSARASIVPVGTTTKSVFYIGPKKQSLLWDLGMKDVMEFGMWRWICYPLVWVINVFNSAIPNYGVAIILLTILVRLLFWPLTHKSTVGMKKLQEIQPLMKEIQTKYKDNPQRMQQETFALYRQYKVNPMSSCLPMLIQIPVFIALFNVLRSAVELRYAPFLWISDLSQPEGLFSSWFPFGGLNILPILMAATMALQSYLTPSTGDKKQQQMMMVMMPVMMLFMFYSFPSALSLYWTLSQVVSIVQMYLIRRSTQAAAK